MLEENPPLHIFGYTARHNDKIADAIDMLRIKYDSRFKMRVSRDDEDKSKPWRLYAKTKGRGFLCPEQTGKLPDCASCGLCWDSKAPVVFQNHDNLRKERHAKRIGYKVAH